MVMHFFGGSPKGKNGTKKTFGDDDDSLDSVSLNDGVNKQGSDKNSGSTNTNTNSNLHDSGGGSSYNYHLPEFQSERLSFQGTSNNFDAKLLKEERQLQKMIARSKVDKPLDKKIKKATDKRREAILKEKVKTVTVVEQDLINQCLGADDDGYCLRHTDQKVRMGIVQPSYRFETISLCQSCAFGAQSGIEVKNHGQKRDKTISHAVNGALVATGVKKKKKKIKGAFAANMNGGSSSTGRDHLIGEGSILQSPTTASNSDNNAHRPGALEFTSDDALGAPSMGDDGNSNTNNHASPHSRTDLEKDARWMEEVQVRVLQVNSWDNSTAPLKCHPNYAKYFRMIGTGIPAEEIKDITGEYGPDLLVLSLDPEKSLNDQINSLPTHIQERLRSNEALMTITKSVHDDESKTVELVYQSYLTQLQVFEAFLEEDEAGIDAIRQSMQSIGSDVSGLTNPNDPGTPRSKKKKKLRLTKKIKRLVGATAGAHHTELSTDDEGSEEEVEYSESNTSHLYADNPIPVGPVPIQPLPQAGLRRARRPAAPQNKRRPSRKPITKVPTAGAGATPSSSSSTPDKVGDKKNAETPLTTTPPTTDGGKTTTNTSTTTNGHRVNTSLDSEKMDSIMSTNSTSEELVEEELLRRVAAPPPSSEEEVAYEPPAPPPLPPRRSDHQRTTVPLLSEEDVMKALVEEEAAARDKKGKTTTNAADNKKETDETTPPPVMVIKTFPSAPTKRLSRDSNQKEEEEEEEEEKSIDPLANMNAKEKEADEVNNKNNKEAAADNKEEERRKREEMRKAVEAMHQFKLGSYEDSFGSIPTTVLPDLLPSGEPSIHTHLSSISSHSSDASSSYDSDEESESSDSDDEEDEDEEDGDEKEEQTEREMIDMDEYIHLSDKLIDVNAELFEAKYLLENSQKREEALMEANKAKDRKIVALQETIDAMQEHINTLAAQNAEAGKIMMELTASLEENKRQKLIRRLSTASSVGLSLDSEVAEENARRRSSGVMKRKSYGSQHSSYHRRLSSSLRSSAVSNDGAGEMTPMMIAVSTAASAESNIQEEEEASDVREVPPSAATSNARQSKNASSNNVRQISPKASSNVRQISPKASSNVREVAPKQAETPPRQQQPNAFPHASNVREITPNNRRRVKASVSAEEMRQKDEEFPNPIALAPSPASAPAPPTQTQPRELVIRSFQPSAKLQERRRRKRELEQRLKISVARTHSADEALHSSADEANDMHFTRSARTEREGEFEL